MKLAIIIREFEQNPDNGTYSFVGIKANSRHGEIFKRYITQHFGKENEINLYEDEKEFKLILIIAEGEDLSEREFFDQLKNLPCQTFEKNSDFQPRPVLSLCSRDIMAVSSGDRGNNLISVSLDKRFRYLDSSIWYKYVLFDNNFGSNFKDSLLEIVQNYQFGLYSSVVAKEFFEFQNRLLANSYLEEFGGGHHASEISPFMFHSESQMRKLAKRELENIKKSGGDNLGWQFLLLDDYARKFLTGTNKTKKAIIQNLLADDLSNIQVKDVTLISEALKAVEEKTFDIILLDYLLGEAPGGKNREFGVEFIEKLTISFPADESTEELQLYNKRGPLSKYWIFPVSVFSNAMLDSLKEKGISHISEFFYISRGADPVNTPQLFRYFLYKFMNLQLKEALSSKEEIVRFLIQNPVFKVTDNKNVRIWATTTFGSFIYRFGKKEVLGIDRKRGSVFAETVFQITKNSFVDFQLYDHTKQLLYLLAYGTGLDTTEMWELYISVNDQILEIFGREKDEFSMDETKAMESVLKDIYNYILSLG